VRKIRRRYYTGSPPLNRVGFRVAFGYYGQIWFQWAVRIAKSLKLIFLLLSMSTFISQQAGEGSSQCNANIPRSMPSMLPLLFRSPNIVHCSDRTMFKDDVDSFFSHTIREGTSSEVFSIPWRKSGPLDIHFLRLIPEINTGTHISMKSIQQQKTHSVPNCDSPFS
jgi:hypothetical protein